MTEETHQKPLNIYLPGLTQLGSEDLSLYNAIHASRVDLVTQLSAAGMHVENIDGANSWLKNMLLHAERSDAFVFPPMTSVPENHKNFKAKAAQSWFEFFSLVTGVHIGNREKYGKNGFSKPCVVIDPDGQWTLAIHLLRDLSAKGMFTSRVEDIVQLVPLTGILDSYHEMNKGAVQTLTHALAVKKGKLQKEVRTKYPPDHHFPPFRTDINRHPFGVAFFGSATTSEKSYIDYSAHVSGMLAERGWRMITGAGTEGCMGAADYGFNEGKKKFGTHYPDALFKPVHIGVSTQSILRLEGPPPYLNQLIITDDIYDRMRVMIRGQRSNDPKQRVRDAVKVLFVAPGGTGTLHEFATLMQLATNGNMLDSRKIVLLNFPSHLDPEEGFWDPLISTAKKLGFDNLFEAAQSPEEAIKIADKTYLEWLERHQEYSQLPHPVFNPPSNNQL